MNRQANINFVKELWKLILEIEDLVRTYYQNLAEQEIYDQDDEDNIPEPF